VQNDPWLQVWSKKDVHQGNLLHRKMLENLVAFNESSDIQKILSKVLSFMLLSNQVKDLRKEFEFMDTDGSGEISLDELQNVLMEHAELVCWGHGRNRKLLIFLKV